MEIGTKIKRLRQQARLSQPELAEHLNISQTTLCKIESSSTKKIDFIVIQKICEKFSVGFEYFTNVNQDVKALPDFNEWLKVTDHISDLVVEKMERNANENYRV